MIVNFLAMQVRLGKLKIENAPEKYRKELEELFRGVIKYE